MAAKRRGDDLSAALRTRTPFDAKRIRELFQQLDERRVNGVAAALADYAVKNLPKTINSKVTFSDYRISPYVLLSCASVLGLTTGKLEQFLVDTKLYTSLETSFGKQIEKTFVGFYPVGAPEANRWIDPPEKIVEAEKLRGLNRAEKAAARRTSVWREIDKSCVLKDRRFLVSIKSGPQCINDTQVSEMQRAIAQNAEAWLEETDENYEGIKGLDIVIGLTYGTNATTNNKENQILVKLLASGFKEEDRERKPGVLIDETGRIRVYRVIGMDFWSFIGWPLDPRKAEFVFVEALVALAKAMSGGTMREQVGDALKNNVIQLGESITLIGKQISADILPKWAQKTFTDAELVWLMMALSSFFDEGI